MAASNAAMPSLGTPPPLAAGSLPALDNTFGALLIGTFVALMLYGLIIHQAYRYFRLYSGDILLVKVFVVEIFYFYLVSNYFNPTALLVGVWSMDAQPVLTSIGIFVSQSFFAFRVYLISPKYRLLVAVSVLLTFIALGFAAAATYETRHNLTFAGFKPYTWLDSAAFASTVASDCLTTSVLIITLKRSRTGIKRTDHIVDRLVLYAVNTGLLTSIFNVCALVLALVVPGNMIYIGVSIVSTKVYANSLLAVLNTRRALSEKDAMEPAAIGLSGVGNATRLTSAELWNVPHIFKYVTPVYTITLLSTILNSRTLMVSRGMDVLGASDPFRCGIIARANHLTEAKQWNVPHVPNSGPTTIDIKISAKVEVDVQSEMVLDRKAAAGPASP
ncbi:hypothetical protein C8Q79DRAFT_1007297 [Trametes meyenii]|nr:hypothetical protein C8Q79DRAFT_1007297 [Trametes meyenii]